MAPKPRKGYISLLMWRNCLEVFDVYWQTDTKPELRNVIQAEDFFEALTAEETTAISDLFKSETGRDGMPLLSQVFEEMGAEFPGVKWEPPKVAAETQAKTGENWTFELTRRSGGNEPTRHDVSACDANGNGPCVFTIVWKDDGHGEIEKIHLSERGKEIKKDFLRSLTSKDIQAMEALLADNDINARFVRDVLKYANNEPEETDGQPGLIQMTDNWIFSLIHADYEDNGVELEDAIFSIVNATPRFRGSSQFEVFSIEWSGNNDDDGEIYNIGAERSFFKCLTGDDITAMRMLLSHNHIPSTFVGNVLKEMKINPENPSVATNDEEPDNSIEFKINMLQTTGRPKSVVDACEICYRTTNTDHPLAWNRWGVVDWLEDEFNLGGFLIERLSPLNLESLRNAFATRATSHGYDDDFMGWLFHNLLQSDYLCDEEAVKHEFKVDTEYRPRSGPQIPMFNVRHRKLGNKRWLRCGHIDWDGDNISFDSSLVNKLSISEIADLADELYDADSFDNELFGWVMTKLLNMVACEV